MGWEWVQPRKQLAPSTAHFRMQGAHPTGNRMVSCLRTVAPPWIRALSPAPSIPPISRNLLKRYNREDIYDRVWRKPIWQVAKDLGHTEHALCNACIKLYIPTPPRGYWGLKPSNRDSIERP